MRPRPVVGGRHIDFFVPIDGKSRAVHYWRHSTGVCPKHKPGRHRLTTLTVRRLPMSSTFPGEWRL